MDILITLVLIGLLLMVAPYLISLAIIIIGAVVALAWRRGVGITCGAATRTALRPRSACGRKRQQQRALACCQKLQPAARVRRHVRVQCPQPLQLRGGWPRPPAEASDLTSSQRC
jgi:hypothetical protein